MNPNDKGAYINRGIVKKKLKYYNEALDDYNKAIELDSNYANAYCLRAYLKGFLGLFTEAIEDYTKAIELDFKDAISYYYRGCAKYDIGLIDQANEDFKKAAELDSSFKEDYQDLKNKKNLTKRAIEKYDNVIKIKFEKNEHNNTNNNVIRLIFDKKDK